MDKRSYQGLTLREAMIHAAAMGRMEGWPRCYYWSSVWWRLSAKESRIPMQFMQYSRAQFLLYKDILMRPDHYKSISRPAGISDWLWSGINTKEGRSNG